MEREWTGNVRRLSEADRAEIERRIQDGETFGDDSGGGGLFDEVDPAVPGPHRWNQATKAAALGTAAVAARARRDFVGPEHGRVSAIDREAPSASAIDDVARGILERVASSVSGLAGRRGSDRARASARSRASLPVDARLRGEVERGLRALVVSATDRGAAASRLS